MERRLPMPESSENIEKNDAQEATGEKLSAAEDAVAEELDERISTALYAAGEKKALEPVVLDLREVASFTDHFVITSGTNARQVQAIADGVVEQVRERHKSKPARVEGYGAAEWVLLDYGDFIVHIFEEKARRFYDLERLWRDARRVALTTEDAGAASNGTTQSEG